jgi:dihydrodipicolinate synthase/N-acetylneuraminate lyase
MMSRLGLLSRNEVRLPLVPITDAERKRVLDEVLEQAGLLVKEATA